MSPSCVTVRFVVGAPSRVGLGQRPPWRERWHVSWSLRVSLSSGMETRVRETEQEVGKDVTLGKVIVANIHWVTSCLMHPAKLQRWW